MNIDDIYFAAVNGNKDELKNLLDAGEIDINELIDCGVENGIHTYIPLMFSVISAMIDNSDIKYDSLDMLIEYGADIDAYVELKTDAFTRKIPLLIYIVNFFKSYELAEYFLQKGAYSNIEQLEHYADGHRERYPILYFAINSFESCEMLDLLLRYKADPNRKVLAYNENTASSQLLHLLFYALIDQNNKEKCISLFSYGASYNEEINVGGFSGKMDFYSYIQRIYPSYLSMMIDCYKKASTLSPVYSPVKPVKQKKISNTTSVPSSTPIKPQQEKTADSKPSATSKKQTKKSPKAKLKTAVQELIEFDYDNAEKYENLKTNSRFKMPGLFLPIVFLFFAGIAIINKIFFTNIGVSNILGMIIPAGIYIALIILRAKKYSETKKAAANILSQRTKIIDKLNTMDKELSQESCVRWWNSFNGFEYVNSNDRRLMIWMPFNRMISYDNGVRLCSACTEEENFSGAQINTICKSDQFKTVYTHKIDIEKTYRVAELCLWNLTDGTHVNKYTEAYSEDYIQNELKAYNTKLDNFEKFKNVTEGRYMTTDMVRFLCMDMSKEEFLENRMYRDILYRNHEQKVRSKTHSVTNISDTNIYDHIIQPIGIIAFDSDNTISAIALYRSIKEIEYYKVDNSKEIYDVKRYQLSGNLDKIYRLAINDLKYYPIGKIDPLAAKPKELNDDEWAALLYSTYGSRDIETVSKIMKNMYKKAGDDKRKKLAANI